MKNEIIIFDNQEVKIEVNMHDETVWLTQEQMAKLFGRDVAVISRHIKNVFSEELDKKSNLQKMQIANSDKPVAFYSLDVIISVGYRVKSKNGIIFRKWANNVLKDYLLKGYALNEQRLAILEKKVKLIDIASRIEEINGADAKEIIKVINEYNTALELLDNYDHRNILKPNGTKSNDRITYDNCKEIISLLKYGSESELFALERNKGLSAIIDNIYSSFDGKDLYDTIEEKAANFLYLIIKDHTFIDGNKRIGATLFIYFLEFYNLLFVNGKRVIDNNTLVALTLLIAESNPKEKDILIDLIMNFFMI